MSRQHIPDKTNLNNEHDSRCSEAHKPTTLTPPTCRPSLDPQDWNQFRFLVHSMVDRSIEFLQNIRETPVYNIVPIPSHVSDSLDEPVPLTAQGLEKVCEDFLTLVLPYPTGNIHPRCWGWAAGNGNAGTIISHLMVATMNSNAVGGAQSSTLVERQVLEWCRKILNFPDTSGSTITNGTSMATIIALTIARNHALGTNHTVRLEGIVGGPRLVGYASVETHFCVSKAFELLGLGRNALRLIPVNAQYCIDINELETAISQDLKAGNVPFCIIGNVGSVNTGSIDDLLALKHLAQTYKLWFHVDGAFGALAIIDQEFKSCLQGIEQADSLAFDFHKWLHVPFDAACLLTRDKKVQLATFSSNASYLNKKENVEDYEVYFQSGLELSRGFRALNIWFTIKEHGIRRLGEKINENRKQCQYLVSLLEKYSWIRVHLPVMLNVVCFRIEPKDYADEEKINALNGQVVSDIQKSGLAIPSTALLKGLLHIRCCIINHRATYHDCNVFVDELVKRTELYLSE